MITIKDLTVSYQDTLALEPLSLTIKEPTITGIIGPNGAGKSTLLKGMLGIIDHQGQTLLDQKPLQNSLQRVAYVEQKINIDYHFPIKVKECVSLGLYPQLKLFQGLKSSHWNKVAEALKIVGLEDLAERQISQRIVSFWTNPSSGLTLSVKRLSCLPCAVSKPQARSS